MHSGPRHGSLAQKACHWNIIFLSKYENLGKNILSTKKLGQYDELLRKPFKVIHFALFFNIGICVAFWTNPAILL